MGQVQRKVLFSGRVQGVGFRMTAVSFARGMGVSGTVRNLADGRVELVVSGAVGEVEGLVGRLREHFEAEARTVEECPGTATMADSGIRIIH